MGAHRQASPVAPDWVVGRPTEPQTRPSTWCAASEPYRFAGGFLAGEAQVAAFKLEGWKPGLRIEANPDLSVDMTINERPRPTEPGDNLGRRSASMLSG